MKKDSSKLIIQGMLHPFKSFVRTVKGRGFSIFWRAPDKDVLWLPVGIGLDLAVIMYIYLFIQEPFSLILLVLGFLLSFFYAGTIMCTTGAIAQVIHMLIKGDIKWKGL